MGKNDNVVKKPKVIKVADIQIETLNASPSFLKRLFSGKKKFEKKVGHG